MSPSIPLSAATRPASGITRSASIAFVLITSIGADGLSTP